MHIIGTAGHIDHGKSALVHALTGHDPDRLPDEKRRGMTLDLGFAWSDADSDIFFIDVPGHERLVRHMIAGAGAIDAALLVVAADDGVMPQTREHLAILDLLGIALGVAAVTKSDLVTHDRLEAILAEVTHVLATTTLKQSKVIPCSSKSGAGLDILKGAIAEVVALIPPRASSEHGRLPIDRVFTRTGHGTIVTGTLLEGPLHSNTTVTVSPLQAQVRIRGLEVQNRRVHHVDQGSRVAVNISGTSVPEIRRGMVLSKPGDVTAVTLLDAALKVLPDSPPLSSGLEVIVHSGTAETIAHIRHLGTGDIADSMHYVQLECRNPLPLKNGDTLIVRRPSPASTVAGGMVLMIDAPRRRRADPQTLARLKNVHAGPPEQRLLAALDLSGPRDSLFPTLDTLCWRARLSRLDAQHVVDSLNDQGLVHNVGNRWCSSEKWATILDHLNLTLRQHGPGPRPEMEPRQLFARMPMLRTISDSDLTLLVDTLVGNGFLVRRNTRCALARNDVERGDDSLAHALDTFLDSGIRGIVSDPPMSPDTMQSLLAQRAIVRLAPHIFVRSDCLHQLIDEILSIIDADGSITASELRDHLGASRKIAIALLEYLDNERITRRIDDTRVRGSRSLRTTPATTVSS